MTEAEDRVEPCLVNVPVFPQTICPPTLLIFRRGAFYVIPKQSPSGLSSLYVFANHGFESLPGYDWDVCPLITNPGPIRGG